jgi:endonuclease I
MVSFIIWYLFSAKTYQPVSKTEISVRWKIHKTNSSCKSKKVEYLTKKNKKLVGFKCGCGFEFKQKRLITQKIPEKILNDN